MSSAPSNLAARLALLQFSDSAYPTGAYAHAFGLEGLVEAGLIRDVATAETYLRQHGLPALCRTELPYVRAAHAAAVARDLDRIVALDAESHALRGARELREAAVRIGAQRVALAAEFFPTPWTRALQAALEAGRWRGHLPVAFGALCPAVEIDVSDALASYTYQQIAGAVAALLKLLRLGQRAAQGLTTRLLAASVPWQEEALGLAPDDAGWFTPGLDIASAQHETAYTRLFMS